ncbi:MAG: alpha/beta hydrolase [Oligoflexales bacterium]|nr:alpha/beta hydrolase [Oligoflexales bacterium]
MKSIDYVDGEVKDSITSFQEGFLEEEGVSIHYIFCQNFDPKLTSIVYIPGLMSTAEESLHFMARFPKRKIIGISMRGRGQSSCPEMGFAIENHARDIDRVIRHLRLGKFIIVGQSIGSTYATCFLSLAKAKPLGLVIGDQALCTRKLPEGWAK